jgi:hypothetical protein
VQTQRGDNRSRSLVRTALTRPVSVSIVSVIVFGGGWIFAVITILLFVALHKPVSGDYALILHEYLHGHQSDDLQSQWYRSAGRQIRRLEAIIPGPINAIYSETVAGTAVIRAFGVQSVFISGELFHLHLKYLYICSTRPKIGALKHMYAA